MQRTLHNLLLAIAVWCTIWTATARAQSAAVGTLAEQYLLKSINVERAAAGLKPVIFDPELQAAARGHAAGMMEANTLSHQLTGEPDLTGRGSAAGAHFSRITENVAMGPTIVRMHTALMQSPHHRDNILDDQVNSIGIGVVQGNGTLWAVEDFSHSIEKLSFEEQEQRVTFSLQQMQLQAQPSPYARASCSLASGYVGPRPLFLMRYTTGDLGALPEQLRIRVQSLGVRAATVGACGPNKEKSGFTAYNIAVELYR